MSKWIITIFFLLTSATASAATITVDDGAADAVTVDAACSLREAIQSANSDSAPNADCTDGSGDDVIDLSGVTTEIDLGSALDNLSTNITITGPGADTLTIDAQSGAFAIFTISGTNTVEISGLTMTGASPAAGNGGGIRVSSSLATFKLDACTLTGNTAGGSGSGGGLLNTGTTTILNSTISGNHANGQGGGLLNFSNGQMTIKNSTVSGNTANSNGGGVGQVDSGGAPTLTIVNSTITNNTADNDDAGGDLGGGLNNTPLGTVTITNTLIAANMDGGGSRSDCGGTIGTGGSNLIGDDTNCTFSAGAGDQVGDFTDPIDPKLGVLADNGGATETHGLLINSPAIDAGNPTPVCSGADTDINDEDQRGNTRCVDVDGTGTTIDVGAFELQVHVVDDSGNTGDSILGDGDCLTAGAVCTLRAAIGESNNYPGPEAIRFSITGTIEPTSVLLSITDSLAIFGPGADLLTIDNSTNSILNAVLRFDSSGNAATLGVTNLTLTGGANSTNGGGIRALGATDHLILESMVFTGNAAAAGGGVSFQGSTLEISDTTFGGNTATGANGGGGLYIQSTGDVTATIRRSTFDGNDATSGPGGGMRINYDGAGEVSLTNVTVSGNQATSHGGGIAVVDGTVNLGFVTITQNTADNDNAGGGDGGAFHSGFSGTVINVANSMMVGNTDVSTEEPDCGGSVAFTSGGYNIIGDDAGCAGEFNATGDQVDVIFDGTYVLTDIINTTLADNGGSTQTHALAASSPAIDTADPACNDADGDPLTVDQRDFMRPADGDDNGSVLCDIGAYEDGPCGDGLIDAGETCDDSGESATCDADCSAVVCGDGVTNAMAGEACDDSGESATCDDDCTAVSCGDGNANAAAGEACDDSGESATCNDDCTNVACGDGTTNTTAGEACDDGNTTDSDGCQSTCALPICGDSIVDADEDCDDGNAVDGDGCTTGCVSNLAGMLAAVNPDVDFNNLIVSEVVTLNAPDPTQGPSTTVLAQIAPSSCTCSWTVDPSARGTYADASACTTAFTPQTTGSGTILVDVDCGASGFGSYFQQMTVRDGTGTAGASSGGCSLIR